MMAPQPQALATIAQRTIGFLRMEMGMSGSGAVRSRSTNSKPTIMAAAMSARIGSDMKGWRTPAMFRASMNDTLAMTIRAAPMKSS